jgi:hypothetical protein
MVTLGDVKKTLRLEVEGGGWSGRKDLLVQFGYKAPRPEVEESYSSGLEGLGWTRPANELVSLYARSTNLAWEEMGLLVLAMAEQGALGRRPMTAAIDADVTAGRSIANAVAEAISDAAWDRGLEEQARWYPRPPSYPAISTRNAAHQAAWALATRHLIGVSEYTQADYDQLVAPWSKVMGKVHARDRSLIV